MSKLILLTATTDRNSMNFEYARLDLTVDLIDEYLSKIAFSSRIADNRFWAVTETERNCFWYEGDDCMFTENYNLDSCYNEEFFEEFIHEMDMGWEVFPEKYYDLLIEEPSQNAVGSCYIDIRADCISFTAYSDYGEHPSDTPSLTKENLLEFRSKLLCPVPGKAVLPKERDERLIQIDKVEG